MTIKMILRHLGGGLALYALAAACTAGGSRNDGGSGAASSGGGAYGTKGSSAASSAGGHAGLPEASSGVTGGRAGSAAGAGGTAGRGAPGGSTVSDASDGFQNGTRLRARFVEAVPGGKQFLGWYDSERAESCTFSLASDGRQHCMPTAYLTSGTYFADAKCTMPLFGRWSSTCVSGKLYGYTQEACGTMHLYELSEVTPHPDPVYWIIAAMCTKLASDAGPSTYYTGTEIPPSAFVGASEKPE